MLSGANKIERLKFIRRLWSLMFRISSVLLLAFSSFGERLPVKTYTVGDGLLRDNVMRIRQDSRGFLWFCTVEGISRFDGYGFTNFTTADGLPNRTVNDFLETREGTILLATEEGIARLNPKGIRGSKENPLFTAFLPENAKTKGFSVLFEDKDGVIWAGTGSGLYRVRETNQRFEFEDVKLYAENVFVTAIIQDRRGVIWIGTHGNGLFRLPPSGQSEHYTIAEGLPNNLVESLLETADGRIWAGMRDRDGGLVRLTAEPAPNSPIAERIYTTKDGLPWNWIPALFQSGDGKFWVATTGGLCLWQGEGGGSACRIYKSSNDLCDKEIWSLAEDKDGNLWTGTRCGLKKIGRYGFTSFAEPDGLSDAFNHSIFQNRAGELFVHSISKGLFISRFYGEKFQTVKPNLPPEVKSFGWGWMQTVWQDSAGAWWIPTGEGLFRFSGVKDFADLARAAPEEMKTGAKSKEVFRLYEDLRGDIWVSLIGGELLRWERAAGIWHDYTAAVGFDKNALGATAFAEDSRGNLWIASSGDAEKGILIRYRDGDFKVFSQTDGAPPGWTRDLFFDHAGRLWIANPNLGLLRIDDPNADKLNYLRFTTAEGLSSMGVYCLTEDKAGRIYIGTGRGLDRLTPETGQIENFTTADGLPNSDVQVAYRGKTNALWFATVGGLARFQPEPVRARKPPTILITGLRVGGEPQSVSILGESEIGGLELNSDQRQVSVDFLGLGATLGEKLRYEYRIESEDWIPTIERTVNFANLSSGSYRFEIRAISAEGNFSAPAAVSFRISAPFWQRPWFILAAAILISLAIYLLYRNRLMRLLEMERMRTRIATDLHDDIGANLTKIAILSEVAQQRFARAGDKKDELLPSIAEISRESVSAMGDIVWAINPKKDSLEDLTRRMRQYASEVLEQRDIFLEFNAPEMASALKLDANTRRNIYLIFKESLNNIVRHARASKVWINLEIAGGEFLMRIEDDGVGFDAMRDQDGNGLTSMKKRAADFGGRLEITSAFDEGTRVELRFFV